METNTQVDLCPKCGATVNYNDGICKACWPTDKKGSDVTKDAGTLKPRIIISIIGAVMVMGPVAIDRPDKIFGTLVFVLIVFIAIFTISSLINIKDIKMRMIFLGIAGLSFAYKLYTSYFLMYMVLPKALSVSLISAAVIALILRGVSLFLEKK